MAEGKPQPIREARGIAVDFPGLRALDNVSLEAQRRDVHAVIGQTGAGKSTLITIICG